MQLWLAFHSIFRFGLTVSAMKNPMLQEIVEELAVNQDIQSGLTAHFDVSFPRYVIEELQQFVSWGEGMRTRRLTLPVWCFVFFCRVACPLLSVDAIDSTGLPQVRYPLSSRFCVALLYPSPMIGCLPERGQVRGV